jgi:hypothetical protein
MQRLGEILIERGVLSLTELHTALETCRRTGGRLGTQLLEFGYVEEDVLLNALEKQLGVPSVARVKLLHSPVEVRRSLPAHVGRRVQAVPFEEAKGGVKVAMTNPNDRAAIDEIKTHVRSTVLAHVATETAVLDALDGAETEEFHSSAGGHEDLGRARPCGDVGGWDRLWEPPRFRPGVLLATDRRRVVQNTVTMASFPDLSPVAVDPSVSFDPAIDDEVFSELMFQADHRDGIGTTLARFAASAYDRVCLFSVHRRTVSGWMARGRSVVLEDLQSFSVPMEARSLFSDVGHADSFVGALSDNEADRELVRALADPAPIEVVLVPVRVKNRVVAFVLCDDPGHPASRDHVDGLVTACRKAGVAFESMILRKKILS